MHFMPDTEDQDSAAETFWPEGYKLVIREISPPEIESKLVKEKPFVSVYELDYKSKYDDYNLFLKKLAEMAAIGLENGADNAFDDIIDSFLKEAPLPQIRTYAQYFTGAQLSIESRAKLHNIIVDEYSRDNIYVYAYGVGYKKILPSLEEYINQVAELVITGAQNAANDTIENIYRNLYLRSPLSPMRRHPRRLKMW